VLRVGVSTIALAAALGLYALRVFAITGFCHRYFSHRAFKTSRSGQFVFALLGASAVQHGPPWWAARHRQHHAHFDGPGDVHSPRQRGFLRSHLRGLLSRRHVIPDLARVRDLQRYPELRWLDRFDIVVPVALAVALFALGALLEPTAPRLGTDRWQLLVCRRRRARDARRLARRRTLRRAVRRAAHRATGPLDLVGIPARFFIDYFKRHGFLSVNDRPQWRAVRGGSREYVRAVTAAFRAHIRLATPVESVRRLPGAVVVRTRRGDVARHDAVVYAGHADTALALLADPSVAGWTRVWSCGKHFHVSPFMPMDMDYGWRFDTPGERLNVQLRNVRDGRPVSDAALTPTRRPLGSAALAAAPARFPLMTVGAVARIYWQALRLWLKRTPFHRHPERP
jgi:hypothetical protein